MIDLAAALVFAWIVIARAPDSVIGRGLTAGLVEMPARKLAAVRQATVVAVVLALALGGAAWAIDYELFRVVAMAAPEAAIWLSMVEVGTLVEVAAAAIVARSALRVGAVWAMLPRRRASRTRRPERSLPANDDEDRRAA